MTKIMVLLDLDALLYGPEKARTMRALERFFSRGSPDNTILAKELGISEKDADANLAYLIKRTLSDDDGRMKLVRLFGKDGKEIFPMSRTEVEAGEPETAVGGT